MISIVIPVYKVEPYLPRCIESITHQTFTDLEIILVDDGSPDQCGEICDIYAQKDSRIKVIHKKNGGLSDARNAGIEVATRDLISFVDSDDYIASNMIEYLFIKMQQYNADISICAYQPVYDDSDKHENIVAPANDILMSGIDAMEAHFLIKSYANVSSWGKLYKTELFTRTGLRFPVGRIHEDSFTTYQLFYHSQNIVSTNQKLYYYYLRNDSIMGQPFSIKNLVAIDAAREAIAFVANHNLPLIEQVQYQFIFINFGCINQMIHSSDWHTWMKYLKEARENLFNTVPQALSNRYLKRNELFSLLLLKLGYWCYIPTKRLSVKIKSVFKKRGLINEHQRTSI